MGLLVTEIYHSNLVARSQGWSMRTLHTVGPDMEQIVPFRDLCNPVMSVQAFYYSLAISSFQMQASKFRPTTQRLIPGTWRADVNV